MQTRSYDSQSEGGNKPAGSFLFLRVDGAETSRRHVKLVGNSFHGENSVRRVETNGGGGGADNQTSTEHLQVTPPVSHQPPVPDS